MKVQFKYARNIYFNKISFSPSWNAYGTFIGGNRLLHLFKRRKSFFKFNLTKWNYCYVIYWFDVASQNFIYVYNNSKLFNNRDKIVVKQKINIWIYRYEIHK